MLSIQWQWPEEFKMPDFSISPVLYIFLIACVSAFFIMILRYLVLKKFNLKYTLVWLFTAISMLVIAIFPQIIAFICGVIGIETPSNAVFFLAIIFLFLIVMTITAIISHMNQRVYRLSQTQALLEKRVRELEAELDKIKKENNEKDNK